MVSGKQMDKPHYIFARGDMKHTIRVNRILEAMDISKRYSVRPGKEYRHFKGKHYVVLYVGKDANTTEDVVVYRSQHGDFQVWVRPLKEFTEFVDRNGYRGPRFMEIKHDRR